MRIFIRPTRSAEEDLFGPVRELRSPLSMERLKSVVLENADRHVSVWNYFWSMLVEVLALGVVTGVVWNYSLAGSNGVVAKRHFVASNIKASISDIPTVAHSSSSLIVLSHGTSDRAREPVRSLPSEILPLKNEIVGMISTVEPRVLTSRIQVPIQKLVDNSALPTISTSLATGNSIPEWTFVASGGAAFSTVRMASEGLGVHWNNGWEAIGLVTMNANGSRDKHDIANHKSLTSPLIDDESDQDFAMVGGGNFDIGAFRFRAEAGPALCILTTNSIVPSTGITSPFVTRRTIGAVADISAFYPLTNFFQAGITGTSVIQRSQWTSGIMVSFSVTP